MASWFGRGRQRPQPSDIARSIKELLSKLQDGNSKTEEELAKQMAQMKLIVQGTPGSHCDSPIEFALL